jgi:hypothetical protein
MRMRTSGIVGSEDQYCENYHDETDVAEPSHALSGAPAIGSRVRSIIDTCLKGFAVILGIFISLALVSVNFPQYGLCVSLIVVLAAVIASKRPFRPGWLGSKLVTIPVLCVAVFGVVASLLAWSNQLQELAAKKEREHQELIARAEARLQELRRSDPQAYLAELKAASDGRWESEFAALDKQGYELFVGERRRSEEAARKAQVAKLVDALKTVPPTDTEGMLALYISLNTLEPTHQEYKKKREALTKQVAEAAQAEKAKKAAEERQWIKEVLLIRALRSNMKNPTTFKLEEALRMKDGTLCLTYRAANSFNATVLERAVINTNTTGASTEVTAWNKYCGGKSGTDISYIRQAI